MKYKGRIEITYEQGCGDWPQFHDDRGLYGENNQYWNWDWTINFSKRTKIDKITLYDENDVILYSGTWTFSRANTIKNMDTVSPEEMDSLKWLEYLQIGCKCEIETDEIVDALKEKEGGKKHED